MWASSPSSSGGSGELFLRLDALNYVDFSDPNIPIENRWKLGQNLSLTSITLGAWHHLRIHLDTSGPSGVSFGAERAPNDSGRDVETSTGSTEQAHSSTEHWAARSSSSLMSWSAQASVASGVGAMSRSQTSCTPTSSQVRMSRLARKSDR